MLVMVVIEVCKDNEAVIRMYTRLAQQVDAGHVPQTKGANSTHSPVRYNWEGYKVALLRLRHFIR